MIHTDRERARSGILPASMKILVVGSGGREHAIVWALAASPKQPLLYAAPGNAGIATLAQSVDVAATDVAGLCQAARRLASDLVVVGPEAPLAAGLADALRAQGTLVFGPSQAAAEIEASKVWTKAFLTRQGIPSARSETVTSEAEARAALRRSGLPVAIKADGLAGGKGVWVAHTEDEAEQALRVLFRQRALGSAGERVLIEELLAGRELSVLAFADGDRWALMPPARDYKRLLDQDQGPNTGGMGGFTRPADATPELMARVEEEIISPTLRGLRDEGRPYSGVLYAGLMLTAQGPRVLEFNCRFGDPETQLILPLLESDLLDTLLQVAQGNLDPASLAWSPEATCGVVLATPGYPEDPRTGQPISGLESVGTHLTVFHSGTRQDAQGHVCTAGGRVLTAVSRASTVEQARQRVYDNLSSIQFVGQQYRRDIGLQPASVSEAHTA